MRSDDRLLSMTDCQDILARLTRVGHGGGSTVALIASDWVAGVQWGRNVLLSTTEVTDHRVNMIRSIDGKESGWLLLNETSDNALVAAMRRAERLVPVSDERQDLDILRRAPTPVPLEPALFNESTYTVDGGAMRVTTAMQLIQQAATAGLLSAGYLEMSAHSLAFVDTLGHAEYFRYTWAQCSVTVRDHEGTGSGWAGVDWPEWSRLDVNRLAATAQEKCLRSRKPVTVEPGRYTTILEPQAVFDLVRTLFGDGGIIMLSRNHNESDIATAPFIKVAGQSMLGDRIVDARLTIASDPRDPELGFPPFWPKAWDTSGYPIYMPVTVVKEGVLTTLPYDQDYGARQLGKPPLPWAGAFRMSGGTTSIAEMIASTTRGLLVTRFDSVTLLGAKSVLVRGYTRDGTWLIEEGAITKPVTNLVATESVLFVLNNIVQLGVPQRIFNPPAQWIDPPFGTVIPQPAIVPSLKISDFSFTALLDAV